MNKIPVILSSEDRDVDEILSMLSTEDKAVDEKLRVLSTEDKVLIKYLVRCLLKIRV